MIPRTLSRRISELTRKLPVVTITGPRQSGKTTLVRSMFPDYLYRNLEFPDVRQFAEEDPRGFLQNGEDGVILDEIQRIPKLLSYIQGFVDEHEIPGRFILTGSQNLLLIRSVSQTLAGRTAILHLLPLSMEELTALAHPAEKVENWIWRGFFPRLFNEDITPADWIPSYISAYVERDIRDIINVQNLSQFQRFLKLCAGRIGQVLNLTSLGNDCGVDQKTVRNWLSVLEATFTVFLLPPFYRNFNKRLIKSPKIYFYDTGLACWLLGIRSPDELLSHYNRGGLFENLIITELIKKETNRGLQPQFYFWRESNGNEVDCIYEKQGKIHAIECKAGKTVTRDYFTGINHLKKIAGADFAGAAIVYGGNEPQHRSDITVHPWFRAAELVA